MDASRLKDKPLPKTFTSAAARPNGMCSLGPREPLIPAASQKQASECTQRHECQIRRPRENSLSMSSDRKIAECSQSDTIVVPRDDNRCSVRNEDTREGLPASTCAKELNTGNIAEDIIKKNAPNLVESSPCLSTGRERQSEVKTTKNNHSAKHSVSGNPFECHEAPSMNVSREVSITGIISRYFSDGEEVSSCKRKKDTCNSEFVGSTIRASECSVDQIKSKMTVESDADTICSINNVIAPDVKQFEAKPTKKNAATDVNKVKQTTRGSSKRTRRAIRPEVRNKARRRLIPTPSSDKLQVGKKLIKAANSISISNSGMKQGKSMFISRCGKFSASQSSDLVQDLAFELYNSEDFGYDL